MTIDETLKENLIADVKNILDIELTDNDETALMRCFEITIGHYLSSPPAKSVSDEDIEKWALRKTELENPKTSVSKYDTLNLIWGAKAMRDGQIPKK